MADIKYQKAPPPTEEEVEAAAELGNELFEKVVNEAEQKSVDVSGVVFSLFVNATHFLASAGWTPGELAKETVDNAISQINYEVGSDAEEAIGLVPQGSA